jgi:TRAP-type C4-dicarboxylate transport system substrate-binding protein
MYESQPWMTRDQHTYNVMIAKVNKQAWNSLPADYQKVIAQAALEARDFQRKLNRECDAAFVAKLKEKGMQVHELTAAERQAFETALQPMYEKGKTIAGEEWVKAAVQFRKDWDTGKLKSQEARYVADYAKITVPVKETMANFK